MKYSTVLAVALLVVPVTASAKSGCSLRGSAVNWTYYSVATGTSPYTISCALTLADGVTSGQCTSSDGQSFTATGALTIASSTDTGGHHRVSNVTQKFATKNPSVCVVTGTMSYPDIGLTETLTNLTINKGRDVILGVGTNATDLISVSFVNPK